MRKIPTDVERLMWLVAEEKDPRAISDFETRFPDLRAELARHMAMVDGLKNARRKMPAHDIPRFVPKHLGPRPALNRSVYVAFALVVVAAAFGMYSVFVLGSASKPPQSAPVAERTDLVRTDPSVTTQPTNPVSVKDQAPNLKKAEVIPPYRPPQPSSQDDPLNKPITLKSQSLPLVAAIALICQKAGVTGDVGPGLQEVDVSLDYENVPTLQILNDLGQKFGFTSLPQEKGKLLIIPVRPDEDHSASEQQNQEPPTHPLDSRTKAIYH